MKPYKKLSFIFLLCFINILTYLVGCCKNEFYKITSIEQIILEHKDSYLQTDTINSDNYILKIIPKNELIAMNSLNSNSALFAFSPCPISIKNCIQESSMSLSIDKDIIYNTKLYPKSTNLIQSLQLNYKLYNSTCQSLNEESRLNGYVDFYLNKEKLDSLQIPKGIAEICFKYTTTDNKNLEFKKQIYINL